MEFFYYVQVVVFEKDDVKKSKKKLFWWFIYIGYVLFFIIVMVVFYFVVEFGGVFGFNKFVSWLIGFIMLLFEFILFFQLIKVIIFVIFYVLVIKKLEVQDDEDDYFKLDFSKDEEYLYDYLIEKDFEDLQKMWMLEQRKIQVILFLEMDFLKII